jgi:hypothetical protein
VVWKSQAHHAGASNTDGRLDGGPQAALRRFFLM